MDHSTRIVRTLEAAVREGVPWRSFKVALVVGSILNAINQGDRIMAGMAPDWLKMVFTYCVPYCVATYGAVTSTSGERPPANVADTE